MSSAALARAQGGDLAGQPAALALELVQGRLQGGELKAVLRTITRRRIGDVVASRKKQGFTIPVERWLASTWLPEIEELQSKPLVETEGWLKPGTLKSAVASVRSSGTAPVQLWSVLVFERWLRRQPAARPAAAEQFITQ